MKLCYYGCGKPAIHTFKNGKSCCGKNVNSCPVIREKISSENMGNDYAKNRPSDFVLDKTKCKNCGKYFSINVINKHYNFCIGNSVKGYYTCLVCKKEFRSYWEQKTCSKICKNKHLSTITSKRVSKQYADGVMKPYGGKANNYPYIFRGNEIVVKGSYELRTCKILDSKLNSKIISYWEYTDDRIPYIDGNGKHRTYFPDFKVYDNDGTWFYLEVKGFYRDIDYYKWKGCLDKNFNIYVWYISDIKKAEDDISYIGNSGIKI